MCSFFNPFLTFLFTSHLFSRSRLCGYSLLALSSCFFPSFYSFLKYRQAAPSASLSLPLSLFLSPSFNLFLSFCPSQSQKPLGLSLLPFYPPTQSPLCPLFSLSVKPADSRLLTVVSFSPRPRFSHTASPLCVCFVRICLGVSVHAFLSSSICVCVCVSEALPLPVLCRWRDCVALWHFGSN